MKKIAIVVIGTPAAIILEAYKTRETVMAAVHHHEDNLPYKALRGELVVILAHWEQITVYFSRYMMGF